jgi:hypothetical protein
MGNCKEKRQLCEKNITLVGKYGHIVNLGQSQFVGPAIVLTAVHLYL